MNPRIPLSLKHSSLAARTLPILVCAALAPRVASAEDTKMLILPTVVASANPCEDGVHAPRPLEPSQLKLARHIDSLLSDSVQDLDLSLEIARPTRPIDEERKAPPPEESLLAMADTRWVVLPRLVINGSRLQLRITAVAPGSRILAMRVQDIDATNVDVRAVVMLGDLVSSQGRHALANPAQEPARAGTEPPESPARSDGRGVLAVSSALLGGFTGYWLQRASGSDDARVTYPLTALGAGIGLGASMLAADEWDITLDDAWLLNAGMVWPTASGFLLARGYDVPSTDRYVYGLLGAGSGLTLASVSISAHKATSGGAIMVHSGGALGTFLGALTEWTWNGKTTDTPSRGMGFGAGIGVVTAGVMATQLDASSTRVLFIDLAASLGALAGAALASPLLFVEKGDLPVNRNRAWLASVGTGTLLGGGLGWWATRSMTAGKHAARPATAFMPFFNVASSPMQNNASSPSGWVAGVSGTW